jgi:hypothetical protein
MVRVLGNNVGAHFDAAVDNVLIDNRRHFEQAIFADGLSDHSVAEFRGLVRDQWQALIEALVPALEAMIARDEAAGTAPADGARHHVRLGLYTHTTLSPAAPAPPPTEPDPS